jgi:hypothetical protein
MPYGPISWVVSSWMCVVLVLLPRPVSVHGGAAQPLSDRPDVKIQCIPAGDLRQRRRVGRRQRGRAGQERLAGHFSARRARRSSRPPDTARSGYSSGLNCSSGLPRAPMR